MPRRFNNMLYAQNRLKAAGGALDAFKAFRNGTSNYSTTAVERGPSVAVGIEAFGFAAGTVVSCRFSGRANTGMDGTGVTGAVAGHKALADATSMRGFIPAKAIIYIGTGAGTEVNSKITGLPYKKRNGESFTIPYGRVAATDTEFERQKALLSAVEATVSRSVSFKPEKLYR